MSDVRLLTWTVVMPSFDGVTWIPVTSPVQFRMLPLKTLQSARAGDIAVVDIRTARTVAGLAALTDLIPNMNSSRTLSDAAQ